MEGESIEKESEWFERKDESEDGAGQMEKRAAVVASH